MTVTSSPTGNSVKAPRLAGFVASRPLFAAITIVALVTAVRLTGTVDSDVAWQLWTGQRLLAGANLYRDIIEINPPLWFWMAVPMDWVASIFHVRAETVLIITMGLLAALSLAASNRLASHIELRNRTLLFSYGALALAAMPWLHIGQREQIVLIGALPYTALITARRRTEQVPSSLAILIGAGAALGFALKHYFLIVPIFLELWLCVGLKRRWRPFRPESVTLVAVGILYAAAIVLLKRNFLTEAVPLTRLAYGVFGAPSLRYLLGPFALIGLILLLVLGTHARLLGSNRAPLAAALGIAALGFAFVYFIQFKGWPYHAIPLIGCASLALAALLAETGESTPILRIVAPALLTIPFALDANEQLHPVWPNPDLVDAVSGLGPGDAVGFLTTESAMPWSVTLQGKYRYASRYMSFWMMRAIVRNEHLGSPDPRLVQLGHRIVAETVSDFACTPPRRIIVSRPRRGDDTFDMLPFFLRDPQMAMLLSHYHVRSRTSLETFEIASPLPLPTGPCRKGI